MSEDIDDIEDEYLKATETTPLNAFIEGVEIKFYLPNNSDKSQYYV